MNYFYEKFKNCPPSYSHNVDLMLSVYQKICSAYGKHIKINSGYRTPEYNAQVGGSPTSSHMQALALDLVIKPTRKEAEKVASILKDFDQVLYYPSEGFIHVGMGSKRRSIIKEM